MTKRKRCLTQQELKQYLKYDYKIGSFSSKEEAYKIYEKRAKDYFGEFYNG